jgi:hypothetical protein
MDEAILLDTYRVEIAKYLEGDDYARCLIFREKLYGDLKEKLYYTVQRTFGTWGKASIEAKRFRCCRIPNNGGLDIIDPSNLLILVSESAKYDYTIRRAAGFVKELRNFLYGHIAELKITDPCLDRLLQQKKLQYYFRSLHLRRFDNRLFEKIVSQLDNLAALLV